jgi:Ca2+-binding RTX toxin-like protein
MPLRIITGQNPIMIYNSSADDWTLMLSRDSTLGAVYAAHKGFLFTNFGHVQDTSGHAVQFNGAEGELINAAGASITGFDIGFSTGGLNQKITNDGVMAGQVSAILLYNPANNVTIVNNGQLLGGDAAIQSTSSAAQNVSITNAGYIHGDIHGINLFNAVGAAPVIVNTGTIVGRLNSIQVSLGDRLDVTNSGALVGNVTATSVNLSDKLVNNGTVTGNVSLGTGVDLYKGTGSVSGYVNGEGGSDTLTGGSFADRLNGGSEVDILTGNGGNDVLIGAAGNDTLAGGLGKDVMAGGANADSFVFNTAPNTTSNRDVINDFVPADDTLKFENAVFTKLGNAGVLNAQFLRLGAAPLDANDYLIYNKATGILTYDVNGNAAGGAQQVAVLTTKPTLTLSDFVVI